MSIRMFMLCGHRMVMRAALVAFLILPLADEVGAETRSEISPAQVSLPDYRQAKWPFVTRDALFDIAVTEQGEAVVVGRGGLVAHRAIGEEIWRVAPMPSDENFFAVTYDDRGTFWIAGDGGRIWKKTSDSETWHPVGLPNDAAIFGLKATNNGAIIAVGEFGNILVSKDRGASWTVETLPWSNYLSEAWAVLGEAIPHLYSICKGQNNGDLLVTGEYGLILKRTDQGWQKLHGGRIEGAIFACALAGNDQILAVGQQGLIIRSQDQGAHWLTVGAPQSSDLFDVAVGQDGLVAVGAKGAVLTSKSGRYWKAVEQKFSARLGNSWLLRAAYGPDGQFIIIGDHGKLLAFDHDELIK